MITLKKTLILSSVACSLCVGSINKSLAQIIPSDSSVNSVKLVKEKNKTTLFLNKNINNRTYSLFDKFNIRSNEVVDIVNRGRVKSNFIFIGDDSPSFIDGTLASRGGADLYLFNNSGFSFGIDSKIDLSGSLFVTTAERFKLSTEEIDLEHLSSLNQSKLLKIDPNTLVLKPSGKSGDINILSNQGIAVKGNNSIGILGGDIVVKNGGIQVANGSIYLYAGGPDSELTIDLDNSSVIASKTLYTDDILIDNLAVLETQGAGNISVGAGGLQLKNGGRIQSSNLGDTDSGTISIVAHHSLDLLGNTDLDSPIDERYSQSGFIVPQKTSILSLASGKGSSSNINIETTDLNISAGADITTATEGFGRGGDINITVADQFILEGELPLIGLIEDRIPFDEPISRPRNIDAALASQVIALSALTNDGGRGGDINIRTGSLKLLNGPQITSGSSRGRGGTLSIVADNDILLSGSTRSGFASSTLTTASIATKDAADTIIRSKRLTLIDGGLIASSALRSGNAGDINIESEIIEIVGRDKNGFLPSQLNSGSFGSGNSGDILLKANVISIQDGAGIFLNSTSIGKTGSLDLEADILSLDNNSMIESNAERSQAGNLDIDSDIVLMRRGSVVQTNASRDFSAGNISIDGILLLGFPTNGNNNITANAEDGTGGVIKLTTLPVGFTVQSIDELRRDNISPATIPSNDITAFSQTNPDIDQGQVIVTSANPGSQLTLPVENLIEPKNLVKEYCSVSQKEEESSSLYLVRKTPSGTYKDTGFDPLYAQNWIHYSSVPHSSDTASNSNSPKTSQRRSVPIREASQWVMTKDSKIALVAPSPYKQTSTCG